MGSIRRPESQAGFRVGPDQQSLYADWLEDVSMREAGVLEAHQSSDALLCAIFVSEGRYLVVGGKDKVLRAYEVQGARLAYVLSGHSASICSLANLGSIFCSGGDHGCNSLILWDCKSWSMRSKVQIHTAAVTCIVDLQDGVHLASASFDKKINIFNHRKGAIGFSVSSSKAGIACMVLSSDRIRLISSALDNSIWIWKIQREEGRLHIINMLTGEVVKRLAVGGSPILDIVLFER
ncbi:unnamed protein product [Sphagnum balticum]